MGRPASTCNVKVSKPNVLTFILKDSWNTLENVTLGIVAYRACGVKRSDFELWLYHYSDFTSPCPHLKETKSRILCPPSLPLSSAPLQPDFLLCPEYISNSCCVSRMVLWGGIWMKIYGISSGEVCSLLRKRMIIQNGRCSNGDICHIWLKSTCICSTMSWKNLKMR